MPQYPRIFGCGHFTRRRPELFRLYRRLQHLRPLALPKDLQARRRARLPELRIGRRGGLRADQAIGGLRSPLHLDRRDRPHRGAGYRRFLGMAARSFMGGLRFHFHRGRPRLWCPGGVAQKPGQNCRRPLREVHLQTSQAGLSLYSVFCTDHRVGRLRSGDRDHLRHLPRDGALGLDRGPYRGGYRLVGLPKKRRPAAAVFGGLGSDVWSDLRGLLPLAHRPGTDLRSEAF